jgi:hypothetical protein
MINSLGWEGMGGSGRGVEPAMLCPNSSSDAAIPQVLPPGRRFRLGNCLKFHAGKQFTFNLHSILWRIHMISALKSAFHRVLLALILVCSLSFNWVLIAQPSYAESKPTLPTLADPQTMPDPEQAYDEAKQIAKDPKMGAEKAYEKEVKVFKDEHPGESIVEKSKEVADTVKAE